MSKHTPGPWILTQSPKWTWSYVITGADGDHVLRYDLWTQSTSDTQETANARPENATCHANARLIAAAPEMLKALKEALDFERHCTCVHGRMGIHDSDCQWFSIHAAISKAEGTE